MFSDTYTSLPLKGRASVRQRAASSSSTTDSSSSDAERQAILAVVQIWLNRLSLVSGITTFFASIDSLLFSLAANATHIGEPRSVGWSAVDKLTTASFAGALIFHVCSAIVAFVGSFVLIRLQLIDADEQEEHVLPATPMRNADTQRPARGLRRSASYSATVASHSRPRESSDSAVERAAGRAADAPQRPLARVVVLREHPLYFCTFRRPAHSRTRSSMSLASTEALDAPVQLLSRCHALAVIMAVLGFVLGVVGILAYAWTATPLAVSVFSIACLGVCLVVSIVVLW